MHDATLLQIIQNAQGELGLAQAASVIGNTDVTTLQMYLLSNRILDEMRRMHPTGWSACMAEYDLVVNPPVITTGNVSLNSPVVTNIASGTASFSAQPSAWSIGGGSVVGQASGQIPQAARLKSVDSPTQVTMTMEATGNGTSATLIFAQDTYPYPSDYDWTQNRTQWDRSNRWELLGPDSAQMDQWHRSGIVATGPRRHWRKFGNLANRFRLWPQPAEIANPLQLAFEYLSVNCVNVQGTGSTFADSFQNDTDKPLLDSEAIIMGVKWKFWQTKGFNYIDMKNDWISYVEQLIARDEGAGTLSLTKRVHPIFLSPANTQDGFFPGPVGPNAA